MDTYALPCNSFLERGVSGFGLEVARLGCLLAVPPCVMSSLFAYWLAPRDMVELALSRCGHVFFRYPDCATSATLLSTSCSWLTATAGRRR